jgi:hypothetical protein
MGCGCGSNSTSTAQLKVNNLPTTSGSLAVQPAATKHLVQFVGSRQGSVSIRVRSGTVYHFVQPARAALVNPRDISYFTDSAEFEVKHSVETNA